MHIAIAVLAVVVIFFVLLKWHADGAAIEARFHGVETKAKADVTTIETAAKADAAKVEADAKKDVAAVEAAIVTEVKKL